MAISALGYVVIRLTLPIFHLRSWKIRAAAQEWADAYGDQAVIAVREKIAACVGYRERKRLYRLHDEIVRRGLPAGE